MLKPIALPFAGRRVAAGRLAGLFVTLFAFCAPAAASEVRAALGGWHYDVSGSVVDGGLVYDFEDDLDIQSQGEYHLELEWRTPAGWWPDVVLGFSRAESGGRRDIPGTPPITQDQTIVATAKTSDLDLTLRYPFEWAAARFAAGVSLKQLVSDVRIDDSAQSEPTDERLRVAVPQGHVSVHWPFSHLVAFTGTLQGIKYQDDLAYDFRAGLELSYFDPVLIEAGWQQKRYEVSSGDYALDADLHGVLLRLRARFPL